ncbi:hypothetical protein [Laspinema olomoucense]|uniref:hypothetical protein n=1 Tax=Laspinema olomoucense TaxID=3231600 RepID=UPI0021BB757A|nr:hypothetical protein [Laspinema sp. D3d]MCT7973645.1 hypothetical protein [Laspinema sp. D3d]
MGKNKFKTSPSQLGSSSASSPKNIQTPPSSLKNPPATRSEPPMNTNATPPNAATNRNVKPEQMSLIAHDNIQAYLQGYNKTEMDKEDLNAVLRLSQHLRVFGLLSAVGYLNQSNAADNNQVRLRTVPVWGCLLNHLLGHNVASLTPQQRQNLMTEVINITRNEPGKYMALWRKSLVLAEQWNFWARAYSRSN